jgi:hypothetical protein
MGIRERYSKFRRSDRTPSRKVQKRKKRERESAMNEEKREKLKKGRR